MDPYQDLSHYRVSWLKKFEKPHKPSKQLTPSGVPPHIGSVPLSISAEMTSDIGPGGAFRFNGTDGINLTLRQM